MEITYEIVYDEIIKNNKQFGYISPAKANLLNLDFIALLADSTCDPIVLKFLARFLSVDTYTNIMDERNINHLCAYPCCSLKPARRNDGNPLRNLSKNMQLYNETNPLHDFELIEKNNAKSLTPFSYLNNFCSKKHFQCSKIYKSQLKQDALFLRDSVFVDHNTKALLNQFSDISKDTKIVLLEEVWLYQAQNNQLSLVDILKDLNINDNSQRKENKNVERIVPPELIGDKIVEKFPSIEQLQEQFDEDELILTIKERAKQIDGYVSER